MPAGGRDGNQSRAGAEIVMRRAGLALAVLLALVACGGSSTSGGPARSTGVATVHVVVLEGTQLFPVEIMQQQGIAGRHGLKLDVTKLSGPQAVDTAEQNGDFDIAFNSWLTVALFRQHGIGVSNVYSMYGFTNDVLVKKDSPIQSFADLKGKRIGLFGGPTGGTTTLFRLICVKYYGFDPVKDAQVQYGAPPLLVNALDRGSLDAVQLLDPVIVSQLETGTVRSIGNIGDIWRQKTGQDPMLVAINVRDSWAAQHADVVKRFILAFREAVQYLRTHREVWTKLAASVGITGPDGVRLLEQRTASHFLTEWNPRFIQAQKAYADQVFKTLGNVQGVPTSIPDGTFNTAYAPGA
jgi:ABC-type nitrate/sulfonate/bicarbonate transport system substrate-binding protein